MTPSRLAKMSYPVPSGDRVQDLKENIQAIKAEMAAASSSTCLATGKKPTLVLVSKLKPPSDLMAAYENLQEDERHFGENYVQEVGCLVSRLVSQSIDGSAQLAYCDNCPCS